MAGAIQRILWHLNLPKEDLSLTYQKFADEFKDEVVEEWLKANISLDRMMTPHHGGQNHHMNMGPHNGQGGSSINRGHGGYGYPRDSPHHSNGSDVTFHEAGHPLQYPNSHRPVTTEL